MTEHNRSESTTAARGEKQDNTAKSVAALKDKETAKTRRNGNGSPGNGSSTPLTTPADTGRTGSDSSSKTTASSAPPARSQADRSTSPLSLLAMLLALIAVAGGYYLWLELSKVQQQTASINAVDMSRLEEVKSTVTANTRSELEQTKSALHTAITQNRTELSNQINAATSQLHGAVTEIRGKTNQALTEIRADVAGLQTQLARLSAAIEQNATSVQTQIQQELSKAVAELNTTLAATDSAVAELRGAFTELKTQVEQRLAESEQSQNALRTELQEVSSTLQQAIGHNRVNWALAEAEHLLNVANRELLIERDVNKAITAMTMAAAALKDIDNAVVVKARETIAQELQALESLPRPDTEQLAITLDQLAKRVGTLPPRSTWSGGHDGQIVEPAGEGDQSGAWETIKTGALKTLNALGVVVRQDGEVLAPMLPPDQAFFLQQNLRLQLMAAQLSLLRQQNDSYHSRLETAIEWVTRFFDPAAAETRHFLEKLNTLNKVDISPELPEINESLKMVRSAQSAV